MKNKFFRCAAAVFLLYAAMFLLINFNEDISLGIKRGINLSLNTVIPSMFLFLIFSDFTMRTGLYRFLSLPFRFLRKPLRFSDYSLSIMILSLIGGYPIGAKLLKNAVNEKRFTANECSDLLMCCVNCGPPFLIGIIGTGLFHNTRLGVYFYLSQIISCFFIAFFTSVKRRRPDFTEKAAAGYSVSSALVGSVNDSIRSLSVICGFIVAFSAFMPIIEKLLIGLPKSTAAICKGLLEVTCGCCGLNGFSFTASVLLISVFTSFGGICVLLQLNAILSGSGISLKKLLLSRIPYSAVAASVMLLFITADKSLCAAAPTTALIIGGNTAELYSATPAATIFMILLAVMFLFSNKTDKKL